MEINRRADPFIIKITQISVISTGNKKIKINDKIRKEEQKRAKEPGLVLQYQRRKKLS